MEKALSRRTCRRLRSRVAKLSAEREDDRSAKRHPYESRQISPGNEQPSLALESGGEPESDVESGGHSLGENSEDVTLQSGGEPESEVESGGHSLGENSEGVSLGENSEDECTVETDDVHEDSDTTDRQSEGSIDFTESLNSSSLDMRENVSLYDGPPLFPGSLIPSSHFNIVFMSLVQRHNLTYACETDILQLLSMILPIPNNIPSSSSTFTHQFADLKSDVIIQHFCGCCSTPLDQESSCSRPNCTMFRGRQSVFIRIPLASQIIERFQGIFHH